MKPAWKLLIIWILLLSTLFSSCSKAPTDSEQPTETDSNEETTVTPNTSEETESQTQTEDETDPLPPTQTGKLPDTKPTGTFLCGDGAETVRYGEQTAEDFSAACLYFEENGFTLYCSRDTDNTLSATYVKGNAYRTLFFSKIWGELTMNSSEDGAQNYPPRKQPYEKICDTTITQPGLSGEGMCEIFRLADGSFLIFDSGTASAGKEIYNELCRLNGSNNIHIRAWVLTHSHSDHYGGFVSYFSEYKYRQQTKLDWILYAPIQRTVADTLASYGTSWDSISYYFNDTLPIFVKNALPATTLCSVHAGQTFTFADVELQILYTSEHLYLDGIPVNYNNTSIISRVVNDEGSVLLMADSGENGTQWALRHYDGELKSDMMQVTHHGLVTNEDLKMMYKVRPTTYFWPCGENKFNIYSGLKCIAKQYAISQAENLIHGYGSVTRTLSHRGKRPVGTEVLTENTEVRGSNDVRISETDTKEILYALTGTANPYVSFATKIDTKKYNALRITVKCSDLENAYLLWTSGSQTPFDFTTKNCKKLGPQGASKANGYVTLLVYLGNGTDYTDDVTSICLRIGENVGDTVSVYSIEAIYIELDS